MVPWHHTSCVMSTSAFTQALCAAWTRVLPEARARIFSVSVICLNQPRIHISLIQNNSCVFFLSRGSQPSRHQRARVAESLQEFNSDPTVGFPGARTFLSAATLKSKGALQRFQIKLHRGLQRTRMSARRRGLLRRQLRGDVETLEQPAEPADAQG